LSLNEIRGIHKETGIKEMAQRGYLEGCSERIIGMIAASKTCIVRLSVKEMIIIQLASLNWTFEIEPELDRSSPMQTGLCQLSVFLQSPQASGSIEAEIQM